MKKNKFDNHSVHNYLRCTYLGCYSKTKFQEDPEKINFKHNILKYHLKFPIEDNPHVITSQNLNPIKENTIYTNLSFDYNGISIFNVMMRRKENTFYMV